MHIVFISNEYPVWATGGKGSFIQTMGRALARAGHRVLVLGIGVERVTQTMEDEGVKLVRLPRPISPLARYIENFHRIRKYLKQLHRTQPIDIVETSELDCAYLPQHTSYKKVIRLHGGHHFFAEAEQRGLNPRKAKREVKSFRNADAFIAISQYVHDETAKYLDMSKRPVALIRNPIDLERFSPSQEQVIPNRIVFAGTVCRKKGVDALLHAFAKARKRKSELNLHLYGRDWTDSNGSSYWSQMKAEHDMQNVTYHGSVAAADMASVYANAQVCCFPSLMETQGLVAPEAMAMGKVVVFTTEGPGPETIEHGVTGFLADPYDVAHLASTLLEAIECDPDVIGQKARESAVARFDPQSILEQNLAFYTTVSNHG